MHHLQQMMNPWNWNEEKNNIEQMEPPKEGNIHAFKWTENNECSYYNSLQLTGWLSYKYKETASMKFVVRFQAIQNWFVFILFYFIEKWKCLLLHATRLHTHFVAVCVCMFIVLQSYYKFWHLSVSELKQTNAKGCIGLDTVCNVQRIKII